MVVKLLNFLETPPMKIILFSRRQLNHTPEGIRQLFDAIRYYGFDCIVNEEFAPLITELTGIEIPSEEIYGQCVGEQPFDSTMVCYGGDGTLLEGVHRLCGAPIPVLGINAGHMGFLTSGPSTDIHQIFGEIAQGHIITQPRSMVKVTGDFIELPNPELALNEFAVQRHGAGMISVETYVDDQMVATYHGDGMLISTPTGSTGYSLSAGGPVVAPTCACFVITPLAPHNLTMRPVVIPDSATIVLHIHAERSEAFVTLDSRTSAISQEATFTIRRAEQKIFLALPHNITFYDTLRNKMMWGIDIRS